MERIGIPEEASAEIVPSAATAQMLYELGLNYCSGREASRDYVTAHKWLNLAALKGSREAKLCRCELSREMTAAEVYEAQRQARAWLTLH
ncbi:MAG: hypothetical protein ACREDX_04345 [Aestuariivirga sp.]